MIVLLLLFWSAFLFLFIFQYFTFHPRFSTTPCVAVAGIAHNVNHALPIIKKYLFQTLKPFSFVFFIYENDSSDGTKETLLKWARQHENIYVKCENGYPNCRTQRNGQKIGNMTTRYSECRNEYLNFFRKRKEKFTVFLVLDLDMQYGFDCQQVRDLVWKCHHEKRAFVSNGILQNFPYDVLAFNDILFPEKIYDMAEEDYWDFSRKHKIRSHMNSIWTYHTVNSAFGGIGIYPFQNAMQSEYRGEFRNTPQCEHIHFHEHLHCPLLLAGFLRPKKGLHVYSDTGDIVRYL